MRDAPAPPQGYFLLLVQEKVAKENDTPDGATQPCAPQALGPALILRGIMPRRSGADILSAPPSGRSPKALRCSGLRHTGTPRKPHISGLSFRCLWCAANPWGTVQADR